MQTEALAHPIVRRCGEAAWRLIGLAIGLHAPLVHPGLDEFMAERNLDVWSEDEVRQTHADAYPLDAKAAAVA